MDIFSIIGLLGGLALFLFGMNVLSDGLEKVAGGKIERILEKLTSNPLKSLVLGMGITAIIQSSSAMTVMLVGLVNSGVMKLGQSIYIIMGSNIGTTVTAWLLSLTGIESDSLFMRLLKPESFSPVVAFIGILMIMISKKQVKKDVGSIFVGFAVLMYGMDFMSTAVEPLATNSQFTSILTLFSNPVLGVLVGAIFTAIIQSSSASVGVLQALSMTGGITFASAIPIIMGQNIGTCVTAFLSSIGANKNARRVAIVHVLFNCIGTLVFLAIWSLVVAFVNIPFVNSPIDPFSIAVIHSIFNVCTTALLFPFAKLLEKASCKIIKEGKSQSELLDERLLTLPSVAAGKALETTKDMAEIAKASVFASLELLNKYDEKKASEITESEGVLDSYEDKLGTYLVKLSKCQLSDADSKNVSMLLHVITDLERIGDHADNLVGVSREMFDKQISFSHEARGELTTVAQAVSEILNITVRAFVEQDINLAKTVEPLEQVIDTIVTEIRTRHITRLQKGSCTIELGFVLTDLLTNCERISDHCSNIAVAMIEAAHGTFDTHEYLHEVKTQPDGNFATLCAAWHDKFQLK
ncbi:MAG: Na/Pi cotransporter family protein [Ruminococcaceae bacterium]|nr:Na/Pi cotransporter family protein [Oscillospiraceae bacterium]